MNYDALVDQLPIAYGNAEASVKLAFLAGFVRAVLARHDADFAFPHRVRTEIDLRTLSGASEGDQRAAMGTPARYAEVLWRGSQSEASELVQGGAATVGHTFLVSVYFGAGFESEAAFTALMESADPERPGLAVALRTVGSGVTEQGDVLEVEAPQDVRVVFTPARPNQTGLARYQHESAFLITLV